MGNYVSVSEEERELRNAAFHGDSRSIQTLLFIGVSVNSLNSNKDTPLHLACLAGNVEIARILLDHGASINLENNNHHKPLHCAVSAGNLDIVHLLEEKGEDIKQVNDFGSLLHAATIADKPEMVKYLLSRGADPFISDQNFKHCPIESCLFYGRSEIFNIFWERDTHNYVQNQKFKNLLQYAVNMDRFEEVKKICYHWDDINSSDETGKSPLALAISRNLPEMVSLLLELGADVQESEIVEGWTPEIRQLVDNFSLLKESPWSVQTHAMYPLHIRKIVKCLLMLSLRDEEGQPRHPQVLLYILPKDVLFFLLQKVVQVSFQCKKK